MTTFANGDSTPLLEATGVSKRYGTVTALDDVDITIRRGRVTCLLGDNGAGKSTLINILSGAERPDAGTIRVDGEEVQLTSPKDALDKGIATVFQDLAVVAIMPVYRNFFLGREPTRGRGPFERLDRKKAERVTRLELERIGIHLEDASRPIATLSGGQRQCVAIARAVYFGARMLILDEPTSALGVKEAEVVLKYIMRARAAGLGVVFITHNVHHAFPVGDSFVILRRGQLEGTFDKRGLAPGALVRHMSGGEELERLEADLALLFPQNESDPFAGRDTM
jgi:simple sugar transport system ATP-binding protein